MMPGTRKLRIVEGHPLDGRRIVGIGEEGAAAPSGFVEESWSQLPDDILISIVMKLSIVDRARLAAVCKSWRRSVLPWLPEMSSGRPTFLHLAVPGDPSSMKLFSFKSSVRCSVPMAETSPVAIRCANFGWLLMSRGSKGLFFFNPLTGQKIEMPQLPASDVQSFCFTSLPTSSDCSILGVQCFYWGIPFSPQLHFRFYHIRRGDMEWKEATLVIEARLVKYRSYLGRSNPAYHKKVFYLLGSRGEFMIYDPKINEARFFRKPEIIPHDFFVWSSYLLECEETLMSVFVDTTLRQVRVYQLEEPSLVWKEIETLNNRVVFLNDVSTLLTDSRQMPELSGMEDRIYFSRFDKEQYPHNPLFYSLKNWRENPAFRNSCDVVEYERGAWIKPSGKHSSAQELIW